MWFFSNLQFMPLKFGSAVAIGLEQNGFGICEVEERNAADRNSYLYLDTVNLDVCRFDLFKGVAPERFAIRRGQRIKSEDGMLKPSLYPPRCFGTGGRKARGGDQCRLAIHRKPINRKNPVVDQEERRFIWILWITDSDGG